jgi:flagellar protein FlaJ
MRFTKQQQNIIAITVALGLIFFAFNMALIKYQPLNVFALLIAISGLVYIEYRKYNIDRKIEMRFPDFVSDLAENIKAGMTLPQAAKSLKSVNYGPLSIEVNRIATQIDWGVPFTETLENFSKKYGKNIQRSVSAIIEAYRGGGKISEILDSTARSIREINKLKKERSSTVYSQIITGYIIFFVFLGILIVLQRYLVPSLGSITPTGPTIGELSILYKSIFQWLIVIQGFFSGIVVGKLSEGKVIAGVKHSIAMVLIGYSVLFFFM